MAVGGCVLEWVSEWWLRRGGPAGPTWWVCEWWCEVSAAGQALMHFEGMWPFCGLVGRSGSKQAAGVGLAAGGVW